MDDSIFFYNCCGKLIWVRIIPVQFEKAMAGIICTYISNPMACFPLIYFLKKAFKKRKTFFRKNTLSSSYFLIFPTLKTLRFFCQEIS